ncbi:hypothetical protein Tco_0039833 [Tanacetum coccineum]
MVEKSKLDEDTQGKAVDPTHYRGMIGTLMYLTASRPDLTFDRTSSLKPYAEKEWISFQQSGFANPSFTPEILKLWQMKQKNSGGGGRSRCIHDRLHGLLLNLSSWLASFDFSPSSFLSGALFQPHGERDISSSFSMHHLSSQGEVLGE